MDDANLHARVARLEREACERYGHDWGKWHTLSSVNGPMCLRYCRRCGRADSDKA